MPHIPGHEDDEQQRQSRERRRAQARRTARTTGGNQTTSRLRQTFRDVRGAARRGAQRVGELGRAALAEGAGLGRRVAQGLRGEPAAEVPRATGAQQAASRVRGAGRVGGPGVEVTQEISPAERAAQRTPGLARRGLALAGRTLGGAGLAVGTGADILEQPLQGLAARAARINPVTAPIARATDVALRRARGEDPLQAQLGATQAGIAAVPGVAGLVPTPEDDPLAGGGPTIRERISAAFPADEGVSPEAAAGAPTTPTGLREFTNVDARAALTDRSPEAIAARRGTATVEENQAVLDRLLAQRGEAGLPIPAAGLRGGFQPGQPQLPQADPAATRLAQGGGLASAFGALALSGNQLRREAAERTRAAAGARGAAEVRQRADLQLRNKLTEIGAQSQADATANFQKDITGLASDRNEAIASEDPAQLQNFDNSIVEAAINNPNSSAAGFANTMLAKALFELGPQTRLGAFFNPFGAGRTTGDALEAFGRGEFNTADLENAFEKVQIDDSGGTFRLVVPRQEGGGFEDVGDVNDLPPPMRRLALQLLVRQTTGQRGDPGRADPRIATQTPVGLRQF